MITTRLTLALTLPWVVIESTELAARTHQLRDQAAAHHSAVLQAESEKEKVERVFRDHLSRYLPAEDLNKAVASMKASAPLTLPRCRNLLKLRPHD